MFDIYSTYKKMEVKINSLNLILDTIDDEFEKNISLKQQEYLMIRKDFNLKKLETCHELKKTLRKSELLY